MQNLIALAVAFLPLVAFARPAEPPFKKVFIVVLENEDRGDAMAQPFLRKLASEGAFLENFKALTHPSYPNYLAMTAADTFGIMSDRQRTIDTTHIGDLLEAKGKTWKNYAEGYPGGCFLGSSRGKYARKHVPFLSYKNVQENAARCARVVPATELYKDIENGTLPDYSFFTPDDDDNGHDTGVAAADRWLEKTFTPLLKDPRFMKDMLFVVTFDEDEGWHGNSIYTALVGDGVRAGTRTAASYDHYSLLRTIEQAFGLGSLGRGDSRADIIKDIFR